MTPAQLADLVRVTAAEVLVERGLSPDALPVDAGVRRPRDAAHGGWSTSVMLRAAGPAGVPARDLAAALARALNRHASIADAAVSGPGFVNLHLDARAEGAVVDRILAEGDSYGRGDELAGQHADLPAPRGERELVVADAVELLLRSQGAEVTRPAARVDPPGNAERYLLLRVPGPASVAVDPALLHRWVDENPAFLVLHAHARLAATARHAVALGVAPGPISPEHPCEADLVRTLARFPQVAATAAARWEPHRVARHAETLARDVDRFLHVCRVLPVGDEEITEVHRARVALCAAARQVLSTALGLLGVGVPERL